MVLGLSKRNQMEQADRIVLDSIVKKEEPDDDHKFARALGKTSENTKEEKKDLKKLDELNWDSDTDKQIFESLKMKGKRKLKVRHPNEIKIEPDSSLQKPSEFDRQKKTNAGDVDPVVELMSDTSSEGELFIFVYFLFFLCELHSRTLHIFFSFQPNPKTNIFSQNFFSDVHVEYKLFNCNSKGKKIDYLKLAYRPTHQM